MFDTEPTKSSLSCDPSNGCIQTVSRFVMRTWYDWYWLQLILIMIYIWKYALCSLMKNTTFGDDYVCYPVINDKQDSLVCTMRSTCHVLSHQKSLPNKDIHVWGIVNTRERGVSQGYKGKAPKGKCKRVHFIMDPHLACICLCIMQ